MVIYIYVESVHVTLLIAKHPFIHVIGEINSLKHIHFLCGSNILFLILHCKISKLLNTVNLFLDGILVIIPQNKSKIFARSNVSQ